jgi:hypothetical protein
MSTNPEQNRHVELYGHRLTTGALRELTQNIANLADSIDRLLSGHHFPHQSGTKGSGDIEGYWISLFKKDLREVVVGVTRHHYYVEADAQVAADQWLQTIGGRTRELLTFGALNDPTFIKRAEALIPQFSKPYEIFNTNEPLLAPAEKFARLFRLGELFGDRSKPTEQFDMAYVPTPEFGVVTLVKWIEPSPTKPTRFAIGINCHKAEWPVMTYSFDAEGAPGPLSLMNARGDTATLLPKVRVPSADSLYQAVMNAMSHDPFVISFEPPTEPNARFLKS